MKRPRIAGLATFFLARWQRGQILPLAAGLLPVLMGFTALSVDMGWLYVNKTKEQRAADAAALAGGLKRLNGGTPDDGVDMAKLYADKNGYDPGAKNPDGSDVVRAYWGPEEPSRYANFKDKITGLAINSNDYIEVKIRKTHPTFFIRILSKDLANMTVRARAVAKVDPIEKNYALLVLNKEQCGAYTHTSSNDITIIDGGAVVNSDANINCGNPICAACQNGSNNITANGDGTCPTEGACTLDHYSGGEWTFGGGATASPPPTAISAQVADPLRCRTDLYGSSIDIWGSKKPIVNGIPTADPGWKPPATSPWSDLCVAPPIPCKNPKTDLDASGNLKVGVTPDPAYCNVLISLDSGGTSANPGYKQIAGGGLDILRPGVYWGGIKLNGSGEIRFLPGIYVLAGGDSNSGGFSYNSGNICPAAVCTGVTFFNTSDPYAANANFRTCGALNFAGSGSLKFEAPLDPPPDPVWPWPVPPADFAPSTNGWKNMLFWQSHTCNPQPVFTYGGASGGDWSISGVVYMPKAKMNVNGGAAFGAVQLIVDTFNFGGANDVVIKYTPFVMTQLPQVKLVE